MKLILVRRGAVDVPSTQILGQTDTPLAVQGFTDIQRLATSWDAPPPRFVFSSDLKRARQSAQIFAAHFAQEPLIDPRLREITYGQWDGHTWQDTMRDDPEAYHVWSQHWVIQPAPKGESVADLMHRSGSWLSSLLASTDANDTVLAISHQGSIRALLCHVLGLAPKHSLALRIDPAGATCIACHEGRFEVCYSNVSRFQSE
ncbi:MAG: histidine phosphatase family protein [Xanthomonadales bacterium]|nr:histidine phosphatase family protein [Xanthomonadales bacterium]